MAAVAIMARVSDDHAGESLNVAHLSHSASLVSSAMGKRPRPGPRPILPAEIKEHNGRSGSFWAVIDGFVVDASEFVDTHPGGLRKLLSADSAESGATGRPFGFSFSRGRNAHFPDTGKRFSEGAKRFLNGARSANDGPFLPPAEVKFPPHGKIIILGRLEG